MRAQLTSEVEARTALEAKLGDSQQLTASLEADLTTLRAARAEAEAAADSVRQRLEDASLNLTRQAADAVVLEARLAEAQDQLQRLQREAESSAALAQAPPVVEPSAGNRADELTAQLDELKSQVVAATGALEERTHRVAALESQLAESVSTCAITAAAASTADARARDLERELAEAREATSDACRSRDAAVAAAEVGTAALREDIVALRAQAADRDARVRELEDSAAALQRALDAAESRVAEDAQRVAVAEATVSQLQAQVLQLQAAGGASASDEVVWRVAAADERAAALTARLEVERVQNDDRLERVRSEAAAAAYAASEHERAMREQLGAELNAVEAQCAEQRMALARAHAALAASDDDAIVAAAAAADALAAAVAAARREESLAWESKLAAEVAQADAKAAALEIAVSDWRGRASEAQSRADAAAATAEDLTRRLAVVEAETARLAEELSDRSREADAAVDRAAAAEIAASNVEERELHFAEQVASLTARCSAMADKLSQQLQEKEEALAQAAAVAQRSAERDAAMQQQLEQLEVALAARDEEQLQLQVEARQSLERAKRLNDAEVARLSAAYNEASAARSQAAERITALEADLAAADERIDALTAELAAATEAAAQAAARHRGHTARREAAMPDDSRKPSSVAAAEGPSATAPPARVAAAEATAAARRVTLDRALEELRALRGSPTSALPDRKADSPLQQHMSRLTESMSRRVPRDTSDPPTDPLPATAAPAGARNTIAQVYSVGDSQGAGLRRSATAASPFDSPASRVASSDSDSSPPATTSVSPSSSRGDHAAASGLLAASAPQRAGGGSLSQSVAPGRQPHFASTVGAAPAGARAWPFHATAPSPPQRRDATTRASDGVRRSSPRRRASPSPRRGSVFPLYSAHASTRARSIVLTGDDDEEEDADERAIRMARAATVQSALARDGGKDVLTRIDTALGRYHRALDRVHGQSRGNLR